MYPLLDVVLAKSAMVLQAIDEVVRMCPIDCRRPLYSNVVLSVSISSSSPCFHTSLCLLVKLHEPSKHTS